MPSGEIHKYRTHTCGELRGTHTGSVVRLSGWLRNRRDHGGGYFIDLADHLRRHPTSCHRARHHLLRPALQPAKRERNPR